MEKEVDGEGILLLFSSHLPLIPPLGLIQLLPDHLLVLPNHPLCSSLIALYYHCILLMVLLFCFFSIGIFCSPCLYLTAFLPNLHCSQTCKFYLAYPESTKTYYHHIQEVQKKTNPTEAQALQQSYRSRHKQGQSQNVQGTKQNRTRRERKIKQNKTKQKNFVTVLFQSIS